MVTHQLQVRCRTEFYHWATPLNTATSPLLGVNDVSWRSSRRQRCWDGMTAVTVSWRGGLELVVETVRRLHPNDVVVNCPPVTTTSTEQHVTQRMQKTKPIRWRWRWRWRRLSVITTANLRSRHRSLQQTSASVKGSPNQTLYPWHGAWLAYGITAVHGLCTAENMTPWPRRRQT